MSNLVILNRVQTPDGPVAPGTVFPPSEVDRAYAMQAEGGVLADESTLGSALTTATKMRRRGVPWEDIEAFLMGAAGDDVWARVAGVVGTVTCTRFGHPPIVQPCVHVVVYGHGPGAEGEPRLLMRGVQLPTVLLWAGEYLTDNATKQAAIDAGCEVINPVFMTLGDPAWVFAEWSAMMRARGAVTWEEMQVAAARARLAWTQSRCQSTNPLCPPLYTRLGNCNCNPYSPA